jgi:hypothetical protein
MFRRLLRASKTGIEAGEHAHFIHTLLSLVGDPKTWAVTVLSGVASFFGLPAVRDWTPLTIVLASITVAAAVSIIYIAVRLAFAIHRYRLADSTETHSAAPAVPHASVAVERRQLDILFNEDDPGFVRDEKGLYGTTRVRQWYVGVQNASRTKSIDDITLRAKEGQFVDCTVAVAHQHPGRLREREPVIAEFRTLSPGATEMVHLFGLGADEHSEQDILSKPQRFTLEARGRDTPIALLALDYDPSTKPPIIRSAGTASRFISLFEAATRAYELTRNEIVSAVPETFANSPDDILTWYCEAMTRHRDGEKPFVRLWGIRPPSRIREEIYMAPLNNYGFEVEGTEIVLVSRTGSARFEKLMVDEREVADAIAEIAKWAG